jgi:hypothetical protein
LNGCLEGYEDLLLLTRQGCGGCAPGWITADKAVALAVNEVWGIDKESFQLYRYVRNKKEG